MVSPLTLESNGIYLRRDDKPEHLTNCPSQLEDLFSLVLSVRDLRSKYFGGTLSDEHSVQPTPIMEYEQELDLEATDLAEHCAGYKRHDELEEAWVQELQSIVFYRFNNEAESKYKRNRRHHCFKCGRNFPLQSRPLLNESRGRAFESLVRRTHLIDRDPDDANVCRQHPNHPNFEQDKLSYRAYKHQRTKIPDLTIGLVIWDKNQCYRPPAMKQCDFETLREHKMVTALQPKIIEDLENGGSIKPLFKFPKGKKGTGFLRTCRPSLKFPFALWEAKKASEGNAVAQNALQVQMILVWQRDLAYRARIEWSPLVFHFVSAGSEWKLYACHLLETDYLQKAKQQKTEDKLNDDCVFRLLWSGDCADQDKALQLLYLVDIIALWGQFQYKSFAAACVRTLERRQRNGDDWNFRDADLLSHQLTIRASNFRTLRRDPHSTDLTSTIRQLQRAGTQTSLSKLQAEVFDNFRHLSVKNYFIPQRDGFTWLLHRGLRGKDLLVVRMNSEGIPLQPLIIYDATDWHSRSFTRVIVQEKVRTPKNVETDFRYSMNRKSVLEKCFAMRDGYCMARDLQFCAILPLGSRRKIIPAGSIMPRHIQTLVEMLNLQGLIDAVDSEYKLWCTCRKEDVDDMILCESTTCKVGWYHHKCVGTDRRADYGLHRWVCPACDESKSVSLSQYDKTKVEQGIYEASDLRVHRARTVGLAWHDHKWPKPKEVEHMYRRIYPRIEMETDVTRFQSTVDCLEAGKRDSTLRIRAVLRDDPRKITPLKERDRSFQRR